MLIDSHAHISYFEKPLQEQVIKEAFSKGVVAINNISTEVSKIKDVVSSCYGYKNVFCTVGTHPCNVQNEPNITRGKIVMVARKYPEIIGIGETGLDYYHSTEHKELQITKFREHLMAGVAMNMPVIVHTRSADDDTLKIISEQKDFFKDRLKVLIHCFTGGPEFCKKLLELGCFISFSGVITFKNAEEIRASMREVPLERMLIETDSPYLAPEPFRGKQNRPVFVKEVAEFIAKDRGVDFDEFCLTTTKNFCKLFKVKLSR